VQPSNGLGPWVFPQTTENQGEAAIFSAAHTG
jgi:hypothetical protein